LEDGFAWIREELGDRWGIERSWDRLASKAGLDIRSPAKPVATR
jgi:hypothetical protein